MGETEALKSLPLNSRLPLCTVIFRDDANVCSSATDNLRLGGSISGCRSDRPKECQSLKTGFLERQAGWMVCTDPVDVKAGLLVFTIFVNHPFKLNKNPIGIIKAFNL